MHSARVTEQEFKVILPPLDFYIFYLLTYISFKLVWHISNWLYNEMDGLQLSNI